MVIAREDAEWSASTATLPLDQNTPRHSVEDEEDDDDDLEDDDEWAAERPQQRSRKGLRALLLEMDVDDKPILNRKPQKAEHDSGGEEAEEERGVAAHVELRHAEERVRILEARLLDAEETIYHLKAEKLEAWRRVEKLTRLNSGRGGSGAEGTADEPGGERGEESLVEQLRAQIEHLAGQLEELQTHHAVELEQQTAVIREQERELFILNDRLTTTQSYADEKTAQYDQLLARHKQIEYEQKEEDEDDDPVKMIDDGGASVDETASLRWREELIRHPTPHFDLDSPEVQYLLSAWTTNTKKVQYLRTWLVHVALHHDRDLPMEFPMGIELPRLAPEVRDGFLTLVVPLLRKQPWREIHVHTKQYNDQYHTDLRIRVVSRRQ